MKNKKAAMEMSVGTMVTIVLLMIVLVLGVVLIQKIFSGATESVSTINDKVKGEISGLFTDEKSSVVVLLDSSKVAKVNAGEKDFGVAIGAETPDGTATSRERLQYQIKLDNSEANSCSKLLGEATVSSFIHQKTNTWLNFDQFEGRDSFAIVLFDIPEATQKCSQKVLLDVKDTKTGGGSAFAGTFFILEIN